MKKLSVLILSVLLVFFVSACSGGSGHTDLSSTSSESTPDEDTNPDDTPSYTDADLQGPWVLYPSSDDYPGVLIIDDTGAIIASYLSGAHANSYSVNGDGTFTIDLTDRDGASVILAGALSSDTLATWSVSIGAEVLSGEMQKVTDTSICKGWWLGAMQEDGATCVLDLAAFGKFYVTSLGEAKDITGTATLGYVFSIDNTVTAYFNNTLFTDGYEEFIIAGTLADGKIDGRYINQDSVEGTVTMEFWYDL